MEQELYVKEMPKSCYICPCFDTSEAMCSITGTYTKFKQGRILEDCPLKSLHEYKKELVAKVLERIKSLITKYDLLKDYQNCAGYFILDKIIEQIQKEIAEL